MNYDELFFGITVKSVLGYYSQSEIKLGDFIDFVFYAKLSHWHSRFVMKSFTYVITRNVPNLPSN